MKPHREALTMCRTLSTLALLALVAGPAAAQAQLPEPQTRGPIHEAFAQPLDPNPQPGLVVAKQPPPPIPEVPPDQRPEGQNVRWIPGYWGWDVDQNDFLWVSGVYRDMPPGERFVPGSWTQSADGWRWVSGYWAPTDQTALQVVAQPPPASLDIGPSAPPPDVNSAYVPGIWTYNNAQYAWRPGYWSPYQQGLVWVPAHWVWTPAGYVFVPGYWDLPFDQRGLLFAPVAFTGTPWLTPGWCYTPSYAINPALFYGAAFYRPRSGHLYFGNYFGPRYAGLGYQPWYTGIGRYDPALSYYAWTNRGTPNWWTGYRNNYNARLRGTIAGPPVRFAQQTPAARGVVPLNQYTQQVRNVNLVRSAPVQRAVTTHVAAPRVAAPVVKTHSAPVVHAAPRVAPTHVASARPVQHTTTVHHAVPVQHAAPARHAAPVQHAAPAHHAAATHHAAPARHAAPAHHTGSSHHR
jgi:hypothetical protein